jgi:hypothetical protein
MLKSDLSEEESDWKKLLLLDAADAEEPSFRFVAAVHIEKNNDR